MVNVINSFMCCISYLYKLSWPLEVTFKIPLHTLYFLHEWSFHFHCTKINKIKYYIVLDKFLFLIALYVQLHFLSCFSLFFNEYLLFDQSPKDLLERSFVWIFYIQRITEKQNKVVITDRMWARVLASTNQPSFLNPKDFIEKEEPQTQIQLVDGGKY